jgi:hypothetical protein
MDQKNAAWKLWSGNSAGSVVRRVVFVCVRAPAHHGKCIFVKNTFIMVSLPGFGGRHNWPKAGHNHYAGDTNTTTHTRHTRANCRLATGEKSLKNLPDQKRTFVF